MRTVRLMLVRKILRSAVAESDAAVVTGNHVESDP